MGVKKGVFGKALKSPLNQSTEVYTILLLVAIICATDTKTPGPTAPRDRETWKLPPRTTASNR
jgi:hypothetical protein